MARTALAWIGGHAAVGLGFATGTVWRTGSLPVAMPIMVALLAATFVLAWMGETTVAWIGTLAALVRLLLAPGLALMAIPLAGAIVGVLAETWAKKSQTNENRR